MEKKPIFQNARPQQANVAPDPPLSGAEEERGMITKEKNMKDKGRTKKEGITAAAASLER